MERESRVFEVIKSLKASLSDLHENIAYLDLWLTEAGGNACPFSVGEVLLCPFPEYGKNVIVEEIKPTNFHMLKQEEAGEVIGLHELRPIYSLIVRLVGESRRIEIVGGGELIPLEQTNRRLSYDIKSFKKQPNELPHRHATAMSKVLESTENLLHSAKETKQIEEEFISLVGGFKIQERVGFRTKENKKIQYGQVAGIVGSILAKNLLSHQEQENELDDDYFYTVAIRPDRAEALVSPYLVYGSTLGLGRLKLESISDKQVLDLAELVRINKKESFLLTYSDIARYYNTSQDVIPRSVDF